MVKTGSAVSANKATAILRSLFMACGAGRHSLCQDPRHQASALAYGIVGTAADQNRRHRTRQQDGAHVWAMMARVSATSYPSRLRRKRGRAGHLA